MRLLACFLTLLNIACGVCVSSDFVVHKSGFSDDECGASSSSRERSKPVSPPSTSPQTILLRPPVDDMEEMPLSVCGLRGGQFSSSTVDLGGDEPVSPSGYRADSFSRSDFNTPTKLNGEKCVGIRPFAGQYCDVPLAFPCVPLAASRERTPPPSSSWGNEEFPSNFMLAVLSAIAYEAYKSKKIEAFQKPMKPPRDFLKEMSYVVRQPQGCHYIVVSKESDKRVFIAFPGTKFDNLPFSIGSCDSWTTDQYDRASNAMLPKIAASWILKPYTYVMASSFVFSFCCFTNMFYLWLSHKDILLSGAGGVGFFIFGSFMFFNLVPKIAFSAYMKHIVDLREKVKHVYEQYSKSGYEIFFVGHSFGGQTAQIMASLFPNSKAVSFSAPGGGLDLALKVNAHLHTKYGVNIPLMSKDEWENRIFNYGIKGDPVLSLKHPFDLITLHSEDDDVEKGRGLLLHRINEIYLRSMSAYFNELHQKNVGLGAVS